MDAKNEALVDSTKTGLIAIGIGLVTSPDLNTKVIGAVIVVLGVILDYMKYSKR